MPHEEQKREEVSKCCGAVKGKLTHPRYIDIPDVENLFSKCGKPFIPNTEEKCEHGEIGACQKCPYIPSPKTDKSWMDELYEIYEDGRKNEKVPQSYLDFFKVRKFIQDQKSLSYAEGEKNNLAKLIEEAAFPSSYFALEQHSNDWRAGFLSESYRKQMNVGHYSGQTPEEAVKNLLTALKEKKV